MRYQVTLPPIIKERLQAGFCSITLFRQYDGKFNATFEDNSDFSKSAQSAKETIEEAISSLESKLQSTHPQYDKD